MKNEPAAIKRTSNIACTVTFIARLAMTACHPLKSAFTELTVCQELTGNLSRHFGRDQRTRI